MGKIKDFFNHDEIKLALMLGFCIILLALVFKKILNVEIRAIYNAVPGFIALGFEVVSRNEQLKKYARVIYWNLAMLLSTAIVILLHL